MARIKKWLWILVAVLLGIVVVQNFAIDETQFLWLSFKMPRFVLFLLFLAVGFVAGFVYARVRQHRAQKAAAAGVS